MQGRRLGPPPCSGWRRTEMRGNASRYPDKKRTGQDRECDMVKYLCAPGLTKPIRERLTAEGLALQFGVPAKTAQYRLMLQQQRWAAE